MKRLTLPTFLLNSALILTGVALVALYWQQRLGLFIRPDYHVFTYLMGIILAIVGYLGFWFPPKKELVSAHPVKMFLGSLVFLAAWALLLFGPRMSLSTRAAVNRGINLNAASGSSWETADTTSTLLNFGSTQSYTLADWIRLFRRDPEPNNHLGKVVKLEGFVQPNDDGTFAVARFIVSCCVVDASPVAITVDQPLGELTANQWIAIEGVLAVKQTSSGRILVIAPNTLEKIEEPAQPYLY